MKLSHGSLLTVLAIAFTLSSGCRNRDDSIDAALTAIRDGSAKAELQRYFDKRRACAPVLFFRHETGLLEASNTNQGAPVLVAAGLIERAPGNADTGNSYYRPTVAARRWFAFNDFTEKTRPDLCFARREVQEVSLVPDGDRATLRYTFSLVDPAPWMARPDMRAAFPGVALALNNQFAGEETVYFEKGRPRIDPIFPEHLNPPFLDFGVNFRGLTTADLVSMKHSSNS